MFENQKNIPGSISPISNITISNFGTATLLVKSNHTVHAPSLSEMSSFKHGPTLRDGQRTQGNVRQRKENNMNVSGRTGVSLGK